MKEYLYEHFIVLTQTDVWKKEKEDEIIILSLEEISDWNIEKIKEENERKAKKGEEVIKIPEFKLFKMRFAPRKFQKCNLINSENVRVYYWSHSLGAHVMKPLWKEKSGVLTMDMAEVVAQAREQAMKEGRDYTNPELDGYLDKINGLNRKYHFEKNGYFHNADAYGGDWAMSELSVHFNEQSFFIDNLEISKFLVASHWDVEEVLSKASDMLHTEKWSMGDFADFIKMLDTYDTNVRLTYIENEKVCSKGMRMDGGKVSRYEEDHWAPEVIKVINEINEEYREKMAKYKKVTE